jgi:hypothetical protein
MSDISEAALAKRNEELSAENSSLKAENKDRRVKSRDGRAELEKLRAQLVTVTTERDTFKTKAEAGPNEQAATIADLTAKLTSRDHRDAFASVKDFDGVVGADGKTPKYRLADGVSVETIHKLTDYKAEGVTPTAQIVATKLQEAQRAFPLLFAPVDTAAGAATRPIVVAARESGPGVGRGNDTSTVSAAAVRSGTIPVVAGGVIGRI